MLETNQPAKPFLGVRFVLVGFNSIEESKIRYKLIDGGGVDSGQYNPNCTHVIVDKIVYDDPLCVAGRKDCKAVVTGLWVDHSYDIGMAVDFTSVMYRPPKDLNGIPGAKSLVMCLTGYQRQDRDDIMTLVGLMGAQFSKPLVAHKVTHLICYKFEGEKYELGKKLTKTKLVNHRWLEDCLKEWEILPEANYNKSGYELEMMEAEAKDSEEEAEDASLKPFSGENMQRSPCNLKPSFPQAHDSPKLSAETLQIRDPTIISNAKDKSSVQGIDNRSERTSGLDNIPIAKAFGYHDVGGLKETAHGGLAQSNYQSPFRKHAANDLTPDSRRTERTPNSDGKSCPVSYTRKIQRNLGDLSSGHGGFDKVAMKANDLLSSFSKQDQEKNVLDSGFFEPQKGNNLLSGKRPTAYSPQKSKQTSSYGTPNLQKMQSEVRPCIRKSLSPCDKILGVGTSFFDHLHDTGIIEADNEITNGANPATDLRSTDTLTLESTENANQNEKTPPSSSKRIKTSLSGFANFGDFDAGDSSLPAADIRDQNHQQDVKGSAESKQDREGDEPSSINLEVDDNSNTMLLKKKTVARKTLGSRPKIASKANKKGSLYLDRRDSTEDEAVILSKGQEDEKSERPVDAGLCYPIISDEAPKTIETKDALKSEDNAARKTETLDDETETPEDKVEQVLDKAIEEVNAVTVESAEKTDTAEEKETETDSSLKDITASTRQTAPEPGKQGIVSENVEDTNISAPAGPKSKVDGLKRKNTTEKAPSVGKKKAKKVEATEGVESKECVDAEVTCNETDKVNEKDNVKKAVKCPAAKSKHRKASKNNSEKSAEEEKENTPVDGGAEYKAEAKRGTKRQAIKSDDTQLNINKSSEKSYPNSSGKIGSVVNKVRSDSEPVLFILSGHRFQRREFQKVIRRLKGRFCRDSHQWSYQATHFIVPDPIRRTEKFFAAAASGRWILKTDYLTASNEAGKFLKEDDYEWHKNGLNEDGAINLEAPRKWRLLRQRTGHGAFYGMRIIIYGECIAPPLDTLKRVVKAGDGTILATSPPYTRFLNSGVDFAVVSPGMPRVDAWVQEFLKHEVPCVVADYLVEYVCKPGYSLEKHVLYNTHAWANKSFARLVSVAEEVVLESPPPSDCSVSDDDIPCEACGSRDRGDVMLICGDESGLSGCGVGCHIDCCDPPLEVVPEEDWLCSECSSRISRSNTSDKSKKKRSSAKKK